MTLKRIARGIDYGLVRKSLPIRLCDLPAVHRTGHPNISEKNVGCDATLKDSECLASASRLDHLEPGLFKMCHSNPTGEVIILYDENVHRPLRGCRCFTPAQVYRGLNVGWRYLIPCFPAKCALP